MAQTQKSKSTLPTTGYRLRDNKDAYDKKERVKSWLSAVLRFYAVDVQGDPALYKELRRLYFANDELVQKTITDVMLDRPNSTLRDTATRLAVDLIELDSPGARQLRAALAQEEKDVPAARRAQEKTPMRDIVKNPGGLSMPPLSPDPSLATPQPVRVKTSPGGNQNLKSVFDEAKREDGPDEGKHTDENRRKFFVPDTPEDVASSPFVPGSKRVKRSPGDALVPSSGAASVPRLTIATDTEPARQVDEEVWHSDTSHAQNASTFGRQLLLASIARLGNDGVEEQAYLGDRGLKEGDLIKGKSNLVGDKLLAPTDKGYNPGDRIVGAKASMDKSKDSLRVQYGISDGDGVVPSKSDQISSDLIFDSFSTVLPGWGLGMTNKMFLMEEQRQKRLIEAAPLAEPRPWIGPIDSSDRMPKQWETTISRYTRKQIYRSQLSGLAKGDVLERRLGEGSLNILGDDAGLLSGMSSKGLPRPRETFMEPVICNSAPWQPVKVPPGIYLNQVQGRRVFDSLRTPNKLRPSIAQSGGPTFPTWMAYEEIPNLNSMT